MINGLENRQAVKVGEKYLVRLNPHYMEETVIGNEVITLPNTPFLVDSIDNIFTRTKSKPNIIHYIDPETNEIVTLDDVKSIKGEYYNSKLGEYIYATLDMEFSHRKRLEKIKTYVPVYEELDPYIHTKVEFKLIGEIAETGSQFIESALNLGISNFYGSAGYLFKLHGTSVAIDEISKHAGEPYHAENSSTGIRWAKASGSYLFADKEFWWMDTSARLYTTLAAASADEEAIRKTVRNRIQIKANVDIPSKLAYNTLYSKLQTIKNRLIMVVPMKASKDISRSAYQELNSLIDTIETNIKDLEKEDGTPTK